MEQNIELEKLIVENTRSIKLVQKENIPDYVKAERLKYLQKHQESLLAWLNNLENVEFGNGN